MSMATRLRKFRSSSKGRFRPSTELSPREQVIEKIHTNLYQPHWDYWYKKLQVLITKNNGYHGRKTRHETSGIHFVGQAWFKPIPNRDKDEYDILPLHPEYPDLEKEAIRITTNLSELDYEVYDVKRFLAGLLTFPAPSDVMAKALGSALYNRVSQFYSELEEENQHHVWNDATCAAFYDYTNAHDYLITAMCTRVMMNLITQQAYAAR